MVLVRRDDRPFELRKLAAFYVTNRLGVSERPRANDGIMYASEEFIEHYGPDQGITLWNSSAERCFSAEDLLKQDVCSLQVQRDARRRAPDGSHRRHVKFLMIYDDSRGALL